MVTLEELSGVKIKHMEIKVVITSEMLQQAVEKSVIEALSSSYRNPVGDAVTEALKNADGSIKSFVNELITKSITEKTYTEKLQDAVLQKLVATILK